MRLACFPTLPTAPLGGGAWVRFPPPCSPERSCVQTLRNIDELRTWRAAHAQRTVAVVPTMGALHAGHLSLIERARSEADVVVVTVFVNPIQFDDAEDLESYPQTLDDDIIACSQAGVDAIFVPPRAEMYPNGYCTFTEVVGPLSSTLCGASRPGHFRGVTTVVLKLFNLVQPQVAVFGEKDLQQALIIQRMLSDLHVPVRLVVAPTIRDIDGLPLSSRNVRLGEEGRLKALALPRGLDKANRAFADGETTSIKLVEIVYEELLVHPGVEVDYADVVQLHNFADVTEAKAGDLLAVAVFIDGVRLIDHILLGGPALAVVPEAD
ncbi:MAG: pantoate--beta-alanine ligase [Planctomycetota bacterium]|nr:MAG: pantoate--beta-alanine ligase [Planctomycetota bacterium]